MNTDHSEEEQAQVPIVSQVVSEWSLESEHLPGGRVQLTDMVVLGRGSDADIVIEDAHLSRRHAAIRIAGQALQVEDLGSTNGTYLNGERISEGEARAGDEIRLDQLSFRVCGPVPADLEVTRLRDPEATALHIGAALLPDDARTQVFGKPRAWLETADGGRLELKAGVVRIGRTPENDLVLNHPSVSSRHAELCEQQGEWILTDLGSTNGTSVDDREVERASLAAGARLRFGQVNVKFVQESTQQPQRTQAMAVPRGDAGQRLWWLGLGFALLLGAGAVLVWVLRDRLGI